MSFPVQPLNRKPTLAEAMEVVVDSGYALVNPDGGALPVKWRVPLLIGLQFLTVLLSTFTVSDLTTRPAPTPKQISDAVWDPEPKGK